MLRKVRTKINIITVESRGVARTSVINTRKVLTHGMLAPTPAALNPLAIDG